VIVVDDTRATKLPPAGQHPTDLSNAGGFRNDLTGLRVRAHERHEIFAFRVDIIGFTSFTNRAVSTTVIGASDMRFLLYAILRRVKSGSRHSQR